MITNVKICQFQSSIFSQNCQFQSILPDPDHDHCDHNDDAQCDDDDDDIQQYWWDDHVTTFPAQFYNLLSPTDYNELFGDEDIDEVVDHATELTDSMIQENSTATDYDIANMSYAATDHASLTNTDTDHAIMYEDATTDHAIMYEDAATYKDAATYHLSQLLMAVNKSNMGKLVNQSADWCSDKNISSGYICVEINLSQPINLIHGTKLQLPSIYNIRKLTMEKLQKMSTNREKERKEKRPTPNCNSSCRLSRRCRGLKEKG